MPFGVKPQCANCATQVSSMWRKNDKDEVLCNGCALKQNAPSNGNGNEIAKKDGSANSSGVNGNTIVLRKSTRARSSKHKLQSQAKSSTPKGKGRRIIFKKSATKAPTAVATPVTSECVYHKGSYFQVGDVVSLVDMSGDIYFAQLRGLLQDQFCQKSAVITWLLPTVFSPKDQFDPATYIIGPEEEIPRKLDCMEFVCHAPSEYFKAKNTPYPTVPIKPDSCFIWTRFGPQIKPIPNTDDIFNGDS